jgi:hypothetical protein
MLSLSVTHLRLAHPDAPRDRPRFIIGHRVARGIVLFRFHESSKVSSKFGSGALGILYRLILILWIFRITSALHRNLRTGAVDLAKIGGRQLKLS